MPHITLECTSNISINYSSFFKELSDALSATGHASTMGIKCRVVTSDEYYIADGQPDYSMVNLLIRLREGREKAVLERFSQIGLALLKQHCAADIEAKRIIISTEIKELVKDIDLTSNAIR